MPESKPDRQPIALSRSELIRIIALAGVLSFAAGFALADLDGSSLDAFARLGVGVAVIALLFLGFEMRMNRRMSRLEKMLERTFYWKVYSDVYSDMGGVDGETTAEHQLR